MTEQKQRVFVYFFSLSVCVYLGVMAYLLNLSQKEFMSLAVVTVLLLAAIAFLKLVLNMSDNIKNSKEP